MFSRTITKIKQNTNLRGNEITYSKTTTECIEVLINRRSLLESIEFDNYAKKKYLEYVFFNIITQKILKQFFSIKIKYTE